MLLSSTLAQGPPHATHTHLPHLTYSHVLEPREEPAATHGRLLLTYQEAVVVGSAGLRLKALGPGLRCELPASTPAWLVLPLRRSQAWAGDTEGRPLPSGCEPQRASGAPGLGCRLRSVFPVSSSGLGTAEPAVTPAALQRSWGTRPTGRGAAARAHVCVGGWGCVCEAAAVQACVQEGVSTYACVCVREGWLSRTPGVSSCVRLRARARVRLWACACDRPPGTTTWSPPLVSLDLRNS